MDLLRQASQHIFLLLTLCSGAVFADAKHEHEHEADLVDSYLKKDSFIVLDHKTSHEMILNVDWREAVRLEMIFDDNLYEPEQLILKINKPHIITMKNIGEDKHDIAGEDFFSSVVVKEVRTKAVRMASFHLESLYLMPRQQLEIWLIPVRAGKYPFICTLPGHLEDGMEGGFLIQ